MFWASIILVVEFLLGTGSAYMARTDRIAALALCFMVATAVSAQSVNLTLDVYYSDPTDTASNGVWELIATTSDRGLAGATVRLEDVIADAMLMAPTGSATDLPVIGFRESFGNGTITFDQDRGDHLELLFVQPQMAPPGPQALLYDVGKPGGATQPGEASTPAIAGLVGQNIPWNYHDALGDYLDDGTPNDSGAFENGVLLALGMFDAGSAPAFFAGEASSANVFTLLGTATDPPLNGSVVEATVSTLIRNNTTVLAGDANLDGTVDGSDFIIWNNNKFSSVAGWRNADFNGDKIVDGQDFLIWNTNKFTSVDGAVPEPAGGLLAIFFAWTCVTELRRRSSA